MSSGLVSWGIHRHRCGILSGSFQSCWDMTNRNFQIRIYNYLPKLQIAWRNQEKVVRMQVSLWEGCSEAPVTYRKVSQVGLAGLRGGRFQRGRRQAEGDVSGIVLGWSGARTSRSGLSLQPPLKTPHFPRHMGVTSRSWEAWGSFWKEKEWGSVLGQLSWCWHVERTVTEAGSSVKRLNIFF